MRWVSYAFLYLKINILVLNHHFLSRFSKVPNLVQKILRSIYEKNKAKLNRPAIDEPTAKPQKRKSHEPTTTVTFSCDKCEKVFSMNKNLLSHKRNIHSNNNIKYKCPDCESRFTSPYDLKYHLKNAHKKNMDVKNIIKHYGIQIEGSFLR